jgi:hypothetical protein
MSKAWKLSFKIKPTDKQKGWSNIIHATAHGRNYHKYGDRTPGIWFISNTNRLHICSAVNGNKNYCYNTRDLPSNAYSTITIQQIQRNDGQFVYQILVNGTMLHQKINDAPQSFKNVKLYASDPWYKPAKAIVKQLEFKNKPYKAGKNEYKFPKMIFKN